MEHQLSEQISEFRSKIRAIENLLDKDLETWTAIEIQRNGSPKAAKNGLEKLEDILNTLSQTRLLLLKERAGKPAKVVKLEGHSVLPSLWGCWLRVIRQRIAYH